MNGDERSAFARGEGIRPAVSAEQAEAAMKQHAQDQSNGTGDTKSAGATVDVPHVEPAGLDTLPKYFKSDSATVPPSTVPTF